MFVFSGLGIYWGTLDFKYYFLFLTSFISFIVSIPITIYFFNQINILSIFYNLLFVPFISIIIFPLSIITYILPFLEPVFTIFINILEFFSLKLNSISFTKLIFPSLPRYYYILYIIGELIFISYFYNRKKSKMLPIFLLLLFSSLFIRKFANISFHILSNFVLY